MHRNKWHPVGPKPQRTPLEPAKDGSQPAAALPKSAGEHKDIVQADVTGPIGQARHHQLHDPRKSTGGTTKAKAEHPEMPLHSASDKGGPVMVPLVNLSPLAPPTEATGTEKLTPTQCIQATVNSGKREPVPLNELIYLSVVDAMHIRKTV